MRLLIDECIGERLRLMFPGHGRQTARFANLEGLNNGLLLEAAEAAGFDVLITVDQNIPDQQNSAHRAGAATEHAAQPRTAGRAVQYAAADASV